MSNTLAPVYYIELHNLIRVKPISKGNTQIEVWRVFFPKGVLTVLHDFCINLHYIIVFTTAMEND